MLDYVGDHTGKVTTIGLPRGYTLATLPITHIIVTSTFLPLQRHWDWRSSQGDAEIADIPLTRNKPSQLNLFLQQDVRNNPKRHHSYTFSALYSPFTHVSGACGITK
jgi:hypothetical protein